MATGLKTDDFGLGNDKKREEDVIRPILYFQALPDLAKM